MVAGVIALTVFTVFTWGSASAAAGVTVVYRRGDGHTETWYGDGTRFRVQFGGADIGLVVDGEPPRLFLVYDERKAFFDLSSALRKARRGVGQLPPELEERGPPPGPHAYVPSRERRIVGGFQCEMYQRLEGGRVTDEACLVPWGPAVGQPQDYAFMITAAGYLKKAFFGKARTGIPAAPRDGDAPGFAVWQQEIRADRSRGELVEVESVRTGAIPPAVFALPAGAREVDGALEPSSAGRPTPRSAEAPAAKRRRRPPAFVALLVTFGALLVFGHAVLIDLAAGLVYPHTRFVNALFATLVVWVVGVPLAALELPIYVQAPADLLAAFGGLKLAYGATNARTTALLGANALVMLLAALLLRWVAGL